jgi:hypothetical protein
MYHALQGTNAPDQTIILTDVSSLVSHANKIFTHV